MKNSLFVTAAAIASSVNALPSKLLPVSGRDMYY